MVRKFKKYIKKIFSNTIDNNKNISDYDLLLSKLPNCPFCGKHNLKISRFAKDIMIQCKECCRYDPSSISCYGGNTYEEAVARYLKFCKDLSNVLKKIDNL